jgi:hypothetical protein
MMPNGYQTFSEFEHPMTGDRTVEFRMTSASVISGRVYDAEGDPLVKSPVQAFAYRYTDGRRTLASVATGQTNDFGEYRPSWLPSGAFRSPEFLEGFEDRAWTETLKLIP